MQDALEPGGSDMLCQRLGGAAGTLGSQRVHGDRWCWVPGAILGGCGMFPPSSLYTRLLYKKPLALRGTPWGDTGQLSPIFKEGPCLKRAGVGADHSPGYQ